MEFASNGKGNAALTTGIIGTALGGLNALGGGLWGWNNNGYNGYNNGYGCDHVVTREELHYAQALAAKDSEIALLKSEQNTEIKIADVYERLITRINADAKAQAEVNTMQAVHNATNNSAIGILQAQICDLDKLTKTVIPAYNICPRPMDRYNSWTAPTTVAEEAPTT